MRNSLIDIVLVAIIIVIFTVYFIAVSLTFKEDIVSQLKLAEEYARNEEWNQVLIVAKGIKEYWSKHKHLLMFNFAEAEFAVLENHLDYIIGGAESKQLDTTLSNILAAKDLWKNLKLVVPEP